jgi:hypothetical protein
MLLYGHIRFFWLSFCLSHLSQMSFINAQYINALTTILQVCNHTPTITPVNLRSVLLNNGTQSNQHTLEEMMSTCSYGKASFNTTITPYTIKVPCKLVDQRSCNYDDWANYADNYIRHSKKSFVNVSDFDYHIYVLPDISYCKFAGLGTLSPCIPMCRIWIAGSVVNEIVVYFHELGHNLGLEHAWYLGDQYGDLSDAMGYCCNTRCLNAPHSQALHWTKAKTNINLQPYRQVTRLILLKANEYIRIQDFSTTDLDPIYIQYRKSGGKFDNEMMPRIVDEDNTQFFDCVNVYRTFRNNDDTTSRLEAMLCEKNDVWMSEMDKVTVTLKRLKTEFAEVYVTSSI